MDFVCFHRQIAIKIDCAQNCMQIVRREMEFCYNVYTVSLRKKGLGRKEDRMELHHTDDHQYFNNSKRYILIESDRA